MRFVVIANTREAYEAHLLRYPALAPYAEWQQPRDGGLNITAVYLEEAQEITVEDFEKLIAIRARR